MVRAMHRLRRAVAVGIVVWSLAAPQADAAAFTVGASSIVTTPARADQDDARTGTDQLKCSAGAYVEELRLTAGVWAGYPDVAYARLQCRFPGAGIEYKELGHDDSHHVTGDCPGTNPAITGLLVADDRYIKDMKIKCGKVNSSGRPRVEDSGYDDDFLLGHVSTNDDQTSMRCASRKVMTGVQISYREVGASIGFTGIQIWCASVSQA
jgi:hypothetical protein